MTRDDETDLEHFQTGAFCRHWSCDHCDEVCATCGHNCFDHEFEKPGKCLIEGCQCQAFADKVAEVKEGQL